MVAKLKTRLGLKQRPIVIVVMNPENSYSIKWNGIEPCYFERHKGVFEIQLEGDLAEGILEIKSL